MTLSPRIERAIVLAPTLMLSVVLGNHGYSPVPRLVACVGLAATLMTALTLYRHRSSLGDLLIAAGLRSRTR